MGFAETSNEKYQCGVHKTRLDGRILIVTFNRPEANNAINFQFESELYDVLARADQDDEIGAVVLAANGRNWSAGHDILENAEDFVTGKLERGEANQFDGEYWGRTGRITPPWRFSKPLVAAIHGFVGPHANTILIAADFVIAADDTRISFEETKVGTGAPFGSYIFLPFHFPMRVVTQLWSMGGWMDAQTARDLFYVNRIVPLGEQVDVAIRFAREAMIMGMEDFQATKRGIRKIYETIADASNLEMIGYKRYLNQGLGADKIAEHFRILYEKGVRAAVNARDSDSDPEISRI